MKQKQRGRPATERGRTKNYTYTYTCILFFLSIGCDTCNKCDIQGENNMTRDDYIKLHRQTVEAIELVQKHGEANCLIECSNDMFGEKWLSVRRPDWCERHYRARLNPQLKIVPWSSLDEVPLTHWFRLKGTLRLLRVESIDSVSAAVPLKIGDLIVSLRDLHDDYEHAAPCDRHSDIIWLPCGKEVVE